MTVQRIFTKIYIFISLSWAFFRKPENLGSHIGSEWWPGDPDVKDDPNDPLTRWPNDLVQCLEQWQNQKFIRACSGASVVPSTSDSSLSSRFSDAIAASTNTEPEILSKRLESSLSSDSESPRNAESGSPAPDSRLSSSRSRRRDRRPSNAPRSSVRMEFADRSNSSRLLRIFSKVRDSTRRRRHPSNLYAFTTPLT